MQLGPGYMPAAIDKLRLEVSRQVASGVWQRPALRMSWAINVSKWVHCCKAACRIEKDAGNWKQIEVFEFLSEARVEFVWICAIQFLREAIQLCSYTEEAAEGPRVASMNLQWTWHLWVVRKQWFGPDRYSSFMAARVGVQIHFWESWDNKSK